MKRLIEINEYDYHGIKVGVKINRVKGEISLVETQKAKRTSDFKDKSWTFVGRGLEYMKGWSDILAAMQHAISEAKEVLEEDKKQKEKDELEFNIEIMGIDNKNGK